MSMRLGLLLAVVLTGCSDKVKDVLPKLAPQFEPWRGKLEEARARCYDPAVFVEVGRLSPPIEALPSGGNTQFVRCSLQDQETANLALRSALEDWVGWTAPGAWISPTVGEAEYDDARKAGVMALLATRYLAIYGVNHFDEPSARVPGGDVRWTLVLYDVQQAKALTTWEMASDVSERPNATVTDLRYQVHDAALGLIASLPGATVKLPAAGGGELKALKPKTGPPRPLAPPARCKVVFPPGSDVEEVDNVTCADAEVIAKKMQEEGFTATVVKKD